MAVLSKSRNGDVYPCGFKGCERVLPKRFSLAGSEFMCFWGHAYKKWWCAEHWDREQSTPVLGWDD